MHLPELEIICERCHGKGVRYYGDDDGEGQKCSACSGYGYVPTEAGVRILSLVRHNSRLSLSAELCVAGA